MNTHGKPSRGPSRLLLRRLAGVAASLFAFLLIFVAASVIYLNIDANAGFAAQRRRLAAHAAASPLPSPSLAMDHALPDGLSFDRLRLLATHNSYRAAGTRIGLFFINLVQPGEARKLDYSHPELWTQLDEGIRSFELDVRSRLGARGGDFVLAHLPLVDARTTEPDFALALDELGLWSDRNPGHVPLVLILELKEDYSFLDPRLGKFNADALDRLDALIRGSLGARLFGPGDLAADPLAATARRSWPSLAAMRGRILVVLHENEVLRSIYEGVRPALADRAMFVCLPGGQPGSVFAILNEPIADAARIREAVARGSIVRTRADADLDIGADKLAAALSSGAQIVSTDFPPGHPGPSGYLAALPGAATMDILP